MSSEPVEAHKASSQSVASPDERHLKAVLGDLFEHTQVLVRQEIELGKAEVEVRVANAKAALVRGAIAAGLFYAAYLTSLTSLVLLLAQWMPAWFGALIVALLASAGAVIFTRLGQASVQAVKHPSETSSITRQRAHS